MTARCFPPEVEFRDQRMGERLVWEKLRADLPDECALFYSVRVPQGVDETELDFVVAWPGVGICVLEVKGGIVKIRDREFFSSRKGDEKKIPNPMDQVFQGRHDLLEYLRVKQNPAVSALMSHLVVLPSCEVRRDFDTGDFPRALVVDTTELDGLVQRIQHVATTGSGHAPLNDTWLAALVDLLAPSLGGTPEDRAAALEHEAWADLEAGDQAKDTLDLLGKQRRFTVVGGAGTGKTVLAMECAKRLAQDGQRVALVCYSRGLGRYLKQEADGWRRRPAYVGLFHDLAKAWGAPAQGEVPDTEYYERVLPEALGQLAKGRADLFDAVVVDEAQDFGELWWPSLMECLKDKAGGVCVFMDEDQRVFARQAANPLGGEPFVLRKNLRNTKRIAQTFGSLSREQSRAKAIEGPRVRFVQCASEDALSRADDAIDALLDVWEPGQVALITTKNRHPIQREIVELHGDDAYWEGFFAGDDVFYGTVAGFKGLERTAVVLAVNGFSEDARAKEMLYVGLSRARVQLVVVGDPETIASVGGEGVRKRLQDAEPWSP